MQSVDLRAKELFPGSDIVRKYTYKIAGIRDTYTLLARANHTLAMDFAILGDQCAHFPEKIVLNACYHIE
ncbi:MAG: hypothetical protein VB070_07005 [Clostridiaceae bacterium]|nr:hypothetical protein [Clostridiaceae bacterium]